MQPDRNLLKAADEALRRLARSRGKPKRDLHHRLSEQRRHYVVACDLSRGPDAARSSYWEGQAAILRCKLQDAIEAAADGLDTTRPNEKVPN